MTIKPASDLAKNESINVVVVGASKFGKTSLLLTLPKEKLLILDTERGTKGIDSGVDIVSVDRLNSWEKIKDMVCYIAGADPNIILDNRDFSQAHYKRACERFNDIDLSKYEYIAFDSLSNVDSKCFFWCDQQPSVQAKSGEGVNTLAVYGLHKKEMERVIDRLIMACSKHLIFTVNLSKREDEFGRKTYDMMLNGAKVGEKLSAYVDQIATYTEVEVKDKKFRALVCNENEWGYPAGSRFAQTELFEKPNLLDLINKLKLSKTETVKKITKGDAK